MHDFHGAIASGDPYAPPLLPTVISVINKVGNGYIIQLHTNPTRPKPPRVRAVHSSPFEGMDPDTMIDKMVDGVGALLRSVNDAGAGEDWKGSENRQQMREAFKMFFPDMSERIEHLTKTPEPPETVEEPRHEQLVFESKAALMEYLDKNL